MALRNSIQEQNTALKEADFNRKKDQFQQMMAWRDHESNMKDMIFKWKQDKDTETMNDIGGLAQGLGAIDLAPDDPKRPSAIYDAIQRNSRGAKAMPGMIKDAFNSYNTAARATQSKFKSDESDFDREVKNTVGRGQSTDRDLLYHPEVWQYEWEDKSGAKHAPPPLDAKGKPIPDYAKDWTRTENKYATIPNSVQGQPPVYIKLPAQKLTDLTKRLKDLDRRRSNLPSQVNNEYAYPQNTGSQLSTQDQRMLDWARSHPGDPNSARIKEKLGYSD
jgi:hypothetical protein